MGRRQNYFGWISRKNELKWQIPPFYFWLSNCQNHILLLSKCRKFILGSKSFVSEKGHLNFWGTTTTFLGKATLSLEDRILSDWKGYYTWEKYAKSLCWTQRILHFLCQFLLVFLCSGGWNLKFFLARVSTSGLLIHLIGLIVGFVFIVALIGVARGPVALSFGHFYKLIIITCLVVNPHKRTIESSNHFEAE